MVAAMLAFSSCGPAAGLWLTVEAPLLVPSQCDGLVVKILRGPGGAVAFEESFPLSASTAFPVSVSFDEPKKDALTTPLSVTVRATLGGQLAAPWAERTDVVTLTSGRVQELRVALAAP